MTKRKSNLNARHGLKALLHGPAHSLGAMLNARHPKKFKPVPLDRHTTPSAANTERSSYRPLECSNHKE